MLRKHVNQIRRQDLDRLPFHSWNCLTLQLAKRDVDLVIKDEKDMDMILKFLIYSLRTIDGRRGTADSILNKLQIESKQQFREMKKRNTISKMREHQFMQLNEMKVFGKIFLKYKVMIIRAKISFMALR